MDDATAPPAGFENFLTELAKAADLCLKPNRHSLRFSGESPSSADPCQDCALLVEVRDPSGVRRPEGDLELEIYRSGSDVNLMLAKTGDDQAPLLWQGSHSLWMRATSGERCEPPPDGAALEALGRRIRALLQDQSR